VGQVIARMKVLGMRAANGGTLRMAARGIVSYLQGGDDEAAADTKQRSQSPGERSRGGPDVDESRSSAGVVGYYMAGAGGRSQGRARGRGAASMGLAGPVSAPELEAVLMGRHADTGEALLGASGSSGRAEAVADGARVVARRGDPNELLTIPEAAFLIGVTPTYLRQLAENQPQTFFATPTAGDQIDERLARRLIEWMCQRPLSSPSEAYLLADKDTASGHWQVSRREVERFIADRVVPETVMGFDMVCSAPKSVSLLWAVGDDAMRADIAEAFDAAVNATVGYLEQHACYGMVDGRNRPAEGFGVVSFVHDTSRADEAHLHTHNLIANAVRVALVDDDGRPILDDDANPKVVWRAPDGHELLRHVKTAGHLGAAELRHQLAQRWGVTWGPVHSGVAELAAFPDPLLRAFSTRHDQVVEEFAQMVESGLEAAPATEVAAQRSTRTPKKVLANDAVRAVQVAKLADIGWTPERVRGLVAGGRKRPVEVNGTDVAELHARLVGPVGLTERQTTFTSRDVHQAVASWAGDRLSAMQIRSLAEGFLADPGVVLCGVGGRVVARQDPEPVFTTEAMLAAEDNLLALYRQARVDHGAQPRGSVPATVIADAVAAVSAAVAEESGRPDGGLSDEQAQLVAAVAGGGDGIRCAVGPAGTGKTEAMRAAVAGWQQLGYTVLGCANGGTQAEQLGARLGVTAEVVRSWLTRLETAEDPAQIWGPDTVVVIDEATQVSTRDAEKMARWAARSDTVLVFVGDPAQLSSVGAGGWFRHVVYSDGAPSLSQIYRQQGDDMAEVRAALGGLRSQLPERVRGAMDRLAADGRVRVFDDADALLAQVVDDWYSDRQSRLAATARPPKASRMMAAHRREVDLLNAAARRHLALDGTLSGPELVVAGRRFAVGDEVVTLTQAGHNLVPDGAARDRYVRTGTVGQVSEVHLDGAHLEAQFLRVHFAGRGEVKVGWDYLTHQFDDGRTGGLAHGYAITADRSQGSTMHAARAVATDSTSRQAFYVMVSRGERELCAYVIRDRDLDTRADDEQWLPVLSNPGGPLRAVVEQLERSWVERLASDLDPVAWAAQQLRHGRTLADLAGIARHAQTDPQAREGGVPLIVARRAELAEQSAATAAAVMSAPPEVVARLGGRPGGGQHRRSWDAAVGAVGAYRARWSAGPGDAGYGRAATWAVGPRPGGHGSAWADQRGQAEALVGRWAAALDPVREARFWAVIEHIPRQRATAGIHALIAAGVDPARLYSALSERERDSAKAGAAILEYRVTDQLRYHHVDPAAYLLAEPLSAAGEWDRVQRLLDTAETYSLSRRDLSDLCAERRDLLGLVGGHPAPDGGATAAELSAAEAGHDQTAARLAATRDSLATEASRRRPDRRLVADLGRHITGLERRHAKEALQLDMLRQRLTGGDGAGRAGLRERHDLISAAIDLIVDDAVAAAVAHPARYLTALLGPRPAEPADAADWDRRMRAVEAWRHHHLGLPYGQPAAGPDAPPSEQALGPIPDNPIDALGRRRILDRTQATLDLGAGR
jgi:conjugative relaxase-like TrwC/TraI family protein